MPDLEAVTEWAGADRPFSSLGSGHGVQISPAHLLPPLAETPQEPVGVREGQRRTSGRNPH